MASHPRWVFTSHDATLYGATRSLLLLLQALPDPSAARLVVPWDGPLVERARGLGIESEIAHRDAGNRLSPMQRLGHLRRIRSLLRAWKPEALVVNTIAHAAPIMAGRAAGIPSLLHVREHPGYFEPRHALGRARLRGMMTTPERIVSVSEATRRLVVAAGAPEERVDVVYNGVDLDGFTPDAERRAAWRTARGFTDEQVVFGFIGQLIERKGWDLFVEAARAIAEDHPQARFAIVGADPEAADYPALIRAVEGHDFHIEGFAEDIAAAFDGIDLFVNASRGEPFARVNLEAMALECPVIATDVGGNAEAVDASCGLIVPVLAEAIAEAMRAMLGHDRKRLGRQARERVVEHFSAERYQREMLARLESLSG